MSDYGVFEASSTDGHEEEQRQRQAKRDLGGAIEAAREGFGDFLGSSTDKQDYNDRLALVMNDLMQKVADSGVMPVPGVMRKVKAALRPEFRVAKDLSGLSDEELAKQYSSADYFSDEAEDLANELNSRGLTTTDVTRLLRSRKTALKWKDTDFNSWVKMDGGAWSLEVEETGGNFWVYFNGGPADGQMEQLSASSMEEAKAEAESIASSNGITASRKTASRSLSEIAAEIRADWKNVYFGAEPYLDAMSSLDSIDDSYGQDSAKSIVAYFLSNATSWRGETARRVKKELKELSKRRAHKQADYWDDNPGFKQDIIDILDQHRTDTAPGIAPHPDYGEGVWSDEGVKQRVLSLNPNLPPAQMVDAIMREMGDFYDSIDRELAFWYFSQVTGNDYNDYYDAWLEMPSGNYFSRKRKATRKTALHWDRNDGDSASYSSQQSGLDYWIKNVNGQWEWSIFDFLSGEGDQGTAFDFEEAESYIEDFIANSDPDDAFDRLEASKTAHNGTASLKQAGSAQVLQKLEDALNDQRSVDVICSNSPDGSFSGEREIPVDEGLQKVRGWVSAGDLVDTAQGGNFFDFEHRASGENVNFYITQEY